MNARPVRPPLVKVATTLALSVAAFAATVAWTPSEGSSQQRSARAVVAAPGSSASAPAEAASAPLRTPKRRPAAPAPLPRGDVLCACVALPAQA
jgi:hypothetical protein